MAWGANESGQLGDASTEDSDVPVPVTGLSGVISIAAGSADSLALLSDGTVMAWGANENGQLGNASTKRSDVPVPVDGLSGVSAIATSDGGAHSLAVSSDGKVMAWGANNMGQLGDGSTESSDVPVPVAGVEGVKAVAAGGDDSLALLTDGAVMSWGADTEGELGSTVQGANVEFSDVPGQVCSAGLAPRTPCFGRYLTGVTAISAGSNHALALLETGVVGWGNGCIGQLGDGMATGDYPCDIDGSAVSFTPVEVGGGLGDAKLISAGVEYSLAFGPQLPALTAVGPTTGFDSGGEPVVIAGTELGEVIAVHFGTVSAPSFTVNSETSITAISPAESSGLSR
jgi:alpha-tubulin suppressor-like RCC1 family protein